MLYESKEFFRCGVLRIVERVGSSHTVWRTKGYTCGILHEQYNIAQIITCSYAQKQTPKLVCGI